jgi:hypothetical protein
MVAGGHLETDQDNDRPIAPDGAKVADFEAAVRELFPQ